MVVITTSNTYICGHLYIDEWGEDMAVITTSNTYTCGHLYIDEWGEDMVVITTGNTYICGHVYIVTNEERTWLWLRQVTHISVVICT
jgi:hypothetical protein